MGAITGPTLRVTERTTLRDLDNFASKMGDNSRLRGVKNDDGSTTLFITEKRPSLWDRMTGVSKDQREAAKTAVLNVLNAHQDKNFDKNKEDALGLNRQVYHLISTSELLTTANHSVRGSDFKTIAKAAFVLHYEHTGDLQAPQKQGPGLMDGVGNRAYTILENAADEIANMRATPNEVASRLASAFAEAVRGRNDGGVLDGYAALVGERFEREVTEALGGLVLAKMKEIGNVDPTLIETEAFQGIGKQALREMSNELLGGSMPVDGMLVMGDGEFERDRKLGEGAYGVVELYRGLGDEDGEAPMLAVKRSRPQEPTTDTLMVSDTDYAKDDPRLEYARHLGVQGEGHENILRLHGGFIDDNGDFGMVLEYAPHGTLHDAGDKMKVAVREERLDGGDRTLIALTAMKDVAAGLKHMQDRGFIHGDFKLPNIFIGEGGKMKIADFGTAQGGGSYKLTSSVRTENTKYLSPEVLLGARSVGQMSTGKGQELAERSDKFIEDAKATFDDVLSESGVETLVKPFMQATGIELKDTVAVGTPSDVFAFGIGLYQLLTGNDSLPYKGTKENTIAGRLETYANSKDAVAFAGAGKLGEEGVGFFGPSLGDPQIDDLMNGVLHPDPAQRLTMDQVLRHPAMNREGVGTEATREKLLSLLT